ncbi:MAG: 4-hydroxythreonine-4-phosphate dehydrogenase PdxA [Desulfobacterales bacterium]|uniref:4-hydroxythreonine-4-phosphate dehydrogenase n=1 Tax=Candidatus Desulfatibia profunda TaxID=2841695 RepID=A0A8J6TIN6_9BACT|nr:4-hydroxythreonine-4-phosphate dehydrogenase PdxA [Candidatus Desulfatibia profunda]MBL7180214.1 4-hydroxythreonine-4-phosphate dehydrogenase PdxA [Desulfobacterales bacterium]
MSNFRPLIGITMGDPVGVGPEIILLALSHPSIYSICRPLVLGDIRILNAAQTSTGSRLHLNTVEDPAGGRYNCGSIDVLNLSELDPEKTLWGRPTVESSRAMVRYVTTAIDMATEARIAAITTCPINKMAMQIAGFRYSGHTELLAERTKCDLFAMMLAGSRLRVVLVTIHIPLKRVPAMLSKDRIVQTIRITGRALSDRFGCKDPRIAVAGLNPHAGEGGLFGDEEKKIIDPAVIQARNEGFNVTGPFPPDTLFYHAAKGLYDAVVCMYHDQGLIPFKLIHFTDGVNTTLGLPIIRTSVDHGTAYDIAGSGIADPGSLIAAITMAAEQAICVAENK